MPPFRTFTLAAVHWLAAPVALAWIFHTPHEMPTDRNAGFSRQARFGPQQPAKAGVPSRGYEISGLVAVPPGRYSLRERYLAPGFGPRLPFW
jgi:hypothetical protein